MALTKIMLKEILSIAGVTAETADVAIQKIMDGHLASVNALREERDNMKSQIETYKSQIETYKADTSKLADVQKELNELKAKGDPDWQKKFEDEHKAFENYKADIAKAKTVEQKKSLYRDLLTECKVGKNQLDAVLRVTNLDTLEIEDGHLKDIDQLKTNILKTWAGFIMKDNTQGANVDNPPDNNGGQGQNNESRAAQLAAKFHKDLYGE